MNYQPLVTVNILSFNRIDELRNTLTKVYEQDYKNIEVIVVDNASSDGSSEMVNNEFPSVQLIQMEKNIGIAGWNEGFKVAKGGYVLVLDDDAYPDKNSIILSLQEFQNDIEIACITFNLIDINSGDFFVNNWLPSDKNKKTYWPVFVGCAFIVKKNRLPETFIFPDEYFVYQHELPMAAEIYLINKKIAFIPSIIGYHNFKSNQEYKIFNDRMIFRNTLMYIVDYIPYSLWMFYYFQIIVFYLLRSLRHKWLLSYLEVVISTCPIKFRSKIALKYFFFLRSKRIFNLSFLSKLSLN